MARYRLSGPAKADIANILKTSADRHGHRASLRYRALLTAAFRRIAIDPTGHSTADRSELRPGMRSFHIRHSLRDSVKPRVANPVHVIYYRSQEPDLIEIIRVLHERMEPTRYVEDPPGSEPEQR